MLGQIGNLRQKKRIVIYMNNSSLSVQNKYLKGQYYAAI